MDSTSVCCQRALAGVASKKRSVEEIIGKLREAEVALAARPRII